MSVLTDFSVKWIFPCHDLGINENFTLKSSVKIKTRNKRFNFRTNHKKDSYYQKVYIIQIFS